MTGGNIGSAASCRLLILVEWSASRTCFAKNSNFQFRNLSATYNDTTFDDHERRFFFMEIGNNEVW